MGNVIEYDKTNKIFTRPKIKQQKIMYLVISDKERKDKFGRNNYFFSRFTFVLREKEALKGINLDIYKGEITAMIGPSGCGKSTYLRSLNRMNDLIPNVTSLVVHVQGKDIYSPKTYC